MIWKIKTKKTVKFSDVFKGQKKGALGTNGLKHLRPLSIVLHYNLIELDLKFLYKIVN